MGQRLRAVDPNRTHPRDAARSAVKKFRLDREREQLPMCNQSTGARSLFVDEVLRRTERDMPEEIRPRYHVNPWVAIFLVVGSLTGLLMLFISLLD